MRISWLTLLWLGFLAGSLSGQGTDSAVYKCISSHIPKYLRDPTPFSYGSSAYYNFTKCLEKSIYDSGKPCDRMIAANVNIKNLSQAFVDLNFVNTQDKFKCLWKITNCIVPCDQDSSLRCINDLIPGIYNTIKSCSPKGAMIFSKALTRTGCTLSSYQYKLKPFYGPEMHCYPNISKSSGTATSKLGPIYEHFCAKFNKLKDIVFKCIVINLLATRSSHNLDEDYDNRAKEFFRRKSELCEYFAHSTPKLCPSVNVVSCQEDLLKMEALQKPFDVLRRSYAECVYDKYKKCDTTLAKTIKYNLDGIESNATNLSVSFVLIVSQIAIILWPFF